MTLTVVNYHFPRIIVCCHPDHFPQKSYIFPLPNLCLEQPSHLCMTTSFSPSETVPAGPTTSSLPEQPLVLPYLHASSLAASRTGRLVYSLVLELVYKPPGCEESVLTGRHSIVQESHWSLEVGSSTRDPPHPITLVSLIEHTGNNAHVNIFSKFQR